MDTKKREGSTFTGCPSRIQQLFRLIMNIPKGFGLCSGKDEKKRRPIFTNGPPNESNLKLIKFVTSHIRISTEIK